MFSEASGRYTSKLWTALAAIFLLCALPGCANRKQAGIEKLAIPPFENLDRDLSLDWMSRAVGEVLTAQIERSPRIHPFQIKARRDARLAGATHVLHGYYSVFRGRLRVNATLEELDSNRIVDVFAVQGPAKEGILPLAGSIAKGIDPDARPYGTRSTEALKALMQAKSSSDPAAAASAFERGVRLDPDFGAAYTGWARVLAAQGDRSGAERVIEMARGRGERISEIERTRLDLIAAELRGDAGVRRRALAALASLTPSDIQILRGLSAAETAARRYTAAAEWLRKATAADPSNPPLWNELGYAEAYAQNLEGARRALLEYQRLAPEEANPLDSLGDAHYYLGRFREAEDYYLQAYQKSVLFLGGATLYKAARARLMTGDVQGADQIFRKFLEARRAAGDPVLAYREAQWHYMTGRRGRAVEQLAGFAANSGSMPEAVSQAYSQLCAWSAGRGDSQQARAYAAKAAAAARSQTSHALAAVCRFLAEPGASAAGVSSRAARELQAVSSELDKKLAVAYALLLGKHFDEAAHVLREVLNESEPGSPNQVNVLLAWALVESGRAKEAAGLLDTYGTPQLGGEPAFAFLTFPRIFHLRSVVLAGQGRASEAKEAREVFLKLSGSEPGDAAGQ